MDRYIALLIQQNKDTHKKVTIAMCQNMENSHIMLGDMQNKIHTMWFNLHV